MDMIEDLFRDTDLCAAQATETGEKSDTTFLPG